jgi:plastocyanin
MRRTIVVSQLLAVAMLLLVAGGCKNNGSSGYSAPTSPGTSAPTTTVPNTVVISGFAFGPSPITVAKNASITWQNKDNVAHTATADDGTWDTGTIAPGASKSLIFANAGTFAYHCTVHPMMKATAVVQ